MLLPRPAMLVVAITAVVCLLASCGESVDVSLVSTETIGEAVATTEDRIDDLREEDQFQEDSSCAIRNDAQPVAAAMADEAGVEISRAESLASAFETDTGEIRLYYCEWTRIDDDVTGPDGIEGLGVSFGPYDGDPVDYSPTAWTFPGEAREVVSSETLDPLDDGAVVFVCLEFENEDIDDTCQLDWIREGLAVSFYVYGEGVFAVDAQPVIDALTIALPGLVEAIATP